MAGLLEAYEAFAALDSLGIPTPERGVSPIGQPTAYTDPRQSSPFGAVRGSRSHLGMDIVAPEAGVIQGVDATASYPGTVSFAGPRGAYGNMVEITHSAHPELGSTRYGHLDSISVQPGQQVDLGQTIGTVGSTGRSTGAHMHMETINKAGQRVSPSNFGLTTTRTEERNRPAVNAGITNPAVFDQAMNMGMRGPTVPSAPFSTATAMLDAIEQTVSAPAPTSAPPSAPAPDLSPESFMEQAREAVRADFAEQGLLGEIHDDVIESNARAVAETMARGGLAAQQAIDMGQRGITPASVAPAPTPAPAPPSAPPQAAPGPSPLAASAFDQAFGQFADNAPVQGPAPPTADRFSNAFGQFDVNPATGQLGSVSAPPSAGIAAAPSTMSNNHPSAGFAAAPGPVGAPAPSAPPAPELTAPNPSNLSLSPTPAAQQAPAMGGIAAAPSAPAPTSPSPPSTASSAPGAGVTPAAAGVAPALAERQGNIAQGMSPTAALAATNERHKATLASRQAAPPPAPAPVQAPPPAPPPQAAPAPVQASPPPQQSAPPPSAPPPSAPPPSAPPASTGPAVSGQGIASSIGPVDIAAQNASMSSPGTYEAPEGFVAGLPESYVNSAREMGITAPPGFDIGYSPYGTGFANVHQNAPEHVKTAATGPGVLGMSEIGRSIERGLADKASKAAGQMAGRIGGAALGGLVGGPVGALGGGLVGGMIGGRLQGALVNNQARALGGMTSGFGGGLGSMGGGIAGGIDMNSRDAFGGDASWA